MKVASCPRRFASETRSSSSAPIFSSSSNSSRRWVRIISGPSVAIGERHLVLGEGAEGVPDVVLALQRLREQVGGGADLEDDLGLAELVHQLGILRGEDPVADPVGPQCRDDLADLRDPELAALLADVNRHAKARLTRLLDQRKKLAVGVRACTVGTRSGDVDPDDPAWRVADRLLDDDRVLPLGERPVHHQDQPCAHLRVLEARAIEPPDRGDDDVVEVALAAPVPFHRVEAELQRRDPLRAIRASDCRMHGALHCQRARLDQLRPLVDLVERRQVGDSARVGHGDERVELPVVLDRKRNALLVRERPHDLRRDRAAEVGVELRKAVRSRHRASLAAGSVKLCL